MGKSKVQVGHIPGPGALGPICGGTLGAHLGSTWDHFCLALIGSHLEPLFIYLGPIWDPFGGGPLALFAVFLMRRYGYLRGAGIANDSNNHHDIDIRNKLIAQQNNYQVVSPWTAI